MSGGRWMEWYCKECQQEVGFATVGSDARVCPFCGRGLEATAGATAVTRSESERASADVLPATIGRYRVLGKLGAGGLADVFEGEDDQLNRAVAIKVMHA